MSIVEGWLTPAALADQLNENSGTGERPVTAAWVRRQMAAGTIPSVKVGNRRWFTPACAAELERRTNPTKVTDMAGYGRVASRRAG